MFCVFLEIVSLRLFFCCISCRECRRLCRGLCRIFLRCFLLFRVKDLGFFGSFVACMGMRFLCFSDVESSGK